MWARKQRATSLYFGGKMHNGRGRMFVYLWVDARTPTESKFGERFVLPDQDPERSCKKRIRESVGVTKHLIDEDVIQLIQFWDVSELANKIGRNHKGAKMDDWLREQIGYRKGRSEFHKLSGEAMKLKINELLTKLGQPLPYADLSSKQYEVAAEVLEFFKLGKQVIMAELCARFGKSIWSAAVAVEQESELIIIASYVKTVFASFATDLTSFLQFANYVHVDTGDKDYKQQINDALAQNKKVFAYLSLANSTKRQERIDFLFANDKEKLLIVDEADFGAHKFKQAKPLIEKTDDKTRVIVMTGTNSDRAATHWKIDTMVSVTYPELLIQKEVTRNAKAL